MTTETKREIPWRVLSIVLLLFLAFAFMLRRGWFGNAVEVPRPNTTGANPHILKLLETATNDVQRNSSSAESWGKLGMLLMAHHWHSEAIESFEKASQLDSKDFRWMYLRAVLTEQKDLEAAAKLYEQAASSDPNYAPLRYRWATVLMRLDQLDDAAKQFERFTKLEPTLPQGYLGLGRVALARGEFEAAKAHLLQALEKRPESLEVKAELARVELQLAGGKQSPAGAAAVVHVQPDPIEDRVLYEVEKQEVVSRKQAMDADELAAQGDLPAATKAYRELIEKRPELSRPRLNLGLILLRQGEGAEALEVLQKAVAAFPDDPMVHFALASVLETLGAQPEALVHLREAVRLKPDYAQAHYAIALSYERQDDTANAIREYTLAVESDPKYPQAQLALGVALQRQGDFDKAIEHMKNAVELMPNDPVPQQFLARALAAKAQAKP